MNDDDGIVNMFGSADDVKRMVQKSAAFEQAFWFILEYAENKSKDGRPVRWLLRHHPRSFLELAWRTATTSLHDTLLKIDEVAETGTKMVVHTAETEWKAEFDKLVESAKRKL